MANIPSFCEAKQRLEAKVTNRQKRLINILTGQCQGEDAAEERKRLENEIEDRKIAIEKLDAQTCCDICGTTLDDRGTFGVRITKYSKRLLSADLSLEKVRIQVECRYCRQNHDSGRPPQKRIAEKAEIVSEIAKLEKPQLRALARVGGGDDGEDLVQEALVRTLAGAEDRRAGRHWKKGGIDFFEYMWGAVRSISYHHRLSSEAGPFLESDQIRPDAEGAEISMLANVVSSAPAPDQSLIAKEEIERRFKILASDKDATAVLQARLEGAMTGRDVMQEQNLTRTRYAAALSRLQQSAPVIEEHEQLLGLIARWLKGMGYAVLPVSGAKEGLCLYGECGPFDVVVISHSHRLNAPELALDIIKKSRLQTMIITTTHVSEEDIVRPSELAHVPILLKPFGKNELSAVLPKKKSASCFRPKRRRPKRDKTRAASSDTGASRPAKPEKALNLH